MLSGLIRPHAILLVMDLHLPGAMEISYAFGAGVAQGGSRVAIAVTIACCRS
jgi:hypothetical protein